jgi:hypothetical protein
MSRFVLSVIVLALGLLCTPIWVDRAFAERRVALIIGNSAYQNVPILPNPERDARGIADMLQKAGYDVTAAFNVSNLDFKRTIRKFEDTVTDADIAVIYYAGLGLDINGTNYLIPIDAKLATDRDANDETVTLERLIESVDGAKRLRLIILDACRDNPFARTMKAERTASFCGLGAVEPNSIDTLIAYAAKPGTTAQDGGGDHSPFAAALLDNLFVPGLDVRLAFGRVRDEVLKKTGYVQEPFVYGSLGGGNIALVPAASEPVAATHSAGEKSDYELVEKIGTKGEWQVFLNQHPTGFYADLARQQIAKLSTAPAPSTGNQPEPTPTLPPQKEPQTTTVVSVIERANPAAPPGPSTEEQRAWDKLKDSSNAADYRTFIKRYPSSVLANKAQQHLDALDRVAQEKAAKEQADREAAQPAKAEREAEAKRQADEAARQKAALAAAQRAAKAAEQARLDAERQAARTREEEARQAALHKQAAEAEAARKQAEQRAAAPADARQAAQAPARQTATKQARPDAELEVRTDEVRPQEAKPPLPTFPWPPPAASASDVLPRSLFGNNATVGEETAAIIAALEQNGYVERSFYSTPEVGGVALITRLERIKDDGSPASANLRWGGEYQISSLNLVQFLSGLFYADPGHYRVIVFILQEKPFEQSPDKQLSSKQAGELLVSGANVLPPEVAERPVEGSHCTALIYEFANDGNGLHKVESSRLTGRQHLEKAGLFAALENPH